ncbi:metalloregulator ArsR/SmtB family transcription factor [Bacillus sp. FSL W7-1294]|uniref:Putative transcriptional regulator, ArsR family n=1 Tax=Bacillus cereus (strain Q1) TaxID=361100 RepID=B9J6C6_BACCQ|nr:MULTISPECIES: metalloregulator ArsR/SmtB family transcription factor [Bacillus cereus group]ACM15921.1 putative transcriptional regulator, ArsR family [Bacillus cereus Q1]KXY70189.1 ArsR family transcriptional regulator [Bacillus cereus]MED1613358.1 metalloregulator ArsR/SmtB family transcription factor [Bacillus paranthracis]MED1683463.1 metalloregulator ArsR/SmtB family transcription factor [Bacillus paranthracis]ONG89936.1 transcriptional regulator [Bacillus cereus]
MPKAFYMDIEYYERPADILRMLGHPMRLMIVRELISKGPLNVSELQKLLRVPQSTMSQQLIKLKQFKMVSYERKGNEVYYIVSDEKVIESMKEIEALQQWT